MKSKQRQRMDKLVAQRFERMQEIRGTARTGKESLQAILGLEAVLPSEPEQKEQIILYLREGLKGVDRNFTKYPNDVHSVMREKLREEAEGVLYLYLWRQSWGYGRNYCRTSYSQITKNTMIRARNTARRAIAGLVEEQFIIKGLDKEGKPNVTQKGTLYRILTSEEIISGVTEEGYLIKDIPEAGVPILSMPKIGIEGNTDDNPSDSRHSIGVFNMGMSIMGNAQSQHSDMPNMGMPTVGMGSENAAVSGDRNTYAHNRHTQDSHPLKETKDSLKDSLSPRDIISGFYRGIGQKKVTKAKRERAENNLKEILDDGFSLTDIQFAVKWTVENAKEELYDFSITKHTIGQAMAAKAEADAKEARKAEIERIASLEHEERQRMEEERERVEAHKQGLTPEERAKLREKAQKEIRSMDGIKEEFVSEILIEAKENEILKAEM